jgi:FkbM family methyltransferase
MDKHEKPIVSSNMERVLKYVNKEVKCVFEIGAYDGVDIPEIKNLFGQNCIIYAFEPSPECFPKLKEWYESKEVVCNELALSNVTGTTKFVVCLDPFVSDQQERSLWHKTAQSLRHNSPNHMVRSLVETEIDVKVDTIDNYCKHNNIKPNIIFVDTQGSEWEIFDGARTILNDVDIIFTEWSSKELYYGQKMFSDIKQLLAEYGFELKEKINLWEDFHGDAIFVRK